MNLLMGIITFVDMFGFNINKSLLRDDYQIHENDVKKDMLLLFVRVIAAVLMMTHGYPKMEKLIVGGEIKFYNFMWTGPTISLALCVLGELIAPIFVVLGYKFRLACFLLVFTMFVAAFGAHFSDPLSEKEHSLLYYLLFLVLMQSGPGKYSLLHWLQRKKS
jgi:putative oxidoreductase